jgi:uncharacterized coiled-coil DUF342 family protein
MDPNTQKYLYAKSLEEIEELDKTIGPCPMEDVRAVIINLFETKNKARQKIDELNKMLHESETKCRRSTEEFNKLIGFEYLKMPSTITLKYPC